MRKNVLKYSLVLAAALSITACTKEASETSTTAASTENDQATTAPSSVPADTTAEETKSEETKSEETKSEETQSEETTTEEEKTTEETTEEQPTETEVDFNFPATSLYTFENEMMRVDITNIEAFEDQSRINYACVVTNLSKYPVSDRIATDSFGIEDAKYNNTYNQAVGIMYDYCWMSTAYEEPVDGHDENTASYGAVSSTVHEDGSVTMDFTLTSVVGEVCSKITADVIFEDGKITDIKQTSSMADESIAAKCLDDENAIYSFDNEFIKVNVYDAFMGAKRYGSTSDKTMPLIPIAIENVSDIELFGFYGNTYLEPGERVVIASGLNDYYYDDKTEGTANISVEFAAVPNAENDGMGTSAVAAIELAADWSVAEDGTIGTVCTETKNTVNADMLKMKMQNCDMVLVKNDYYELKLVNVTAMPAGDGTWKMDAELYATNYWTDGYVMGDLFKRDVELDPPYSYYYTMPDEKMSYSLTFEGLSEDNLSGEKELAIKGWQDEALGYMFEDNYTVSVSFNGELIAEAK